MTAVFVPRHCHAHAAHYAGQVIDLRVVRPPAGGRAAMEERFTRGKGIPCVVH